MTYKEYWETEEGYKEIPKPEEKVAEPWKGYEGWKRQSIESCTTKPVRSLALALLIEGSESSLPGVRRLRNYLRNAQKSLDKYL